MRNANLAHQTIANGRKLRERLSAKGIYIGPDRTPKQRELRRRLVAIIKERRKSDPERFHFIRGSTVQSRDRFLSASEAPEGDSDISIEPAKADDRDSDNSECSDNSDCSSSSGLCHILFTAKQQEAIKKLREMRMH